MLHNFMMAAQEAGVTMGQFRENPELIARCFGEAAERYALDGIMIDLDTVTLAGAVGVPVDYPDDNPARSHGSILHTLEAVRDLEPVDLSKNHRVQVWTEAVAILVRNYGDEIYIRGNCDQCPFTLAGEMRGLDNWVMDIAGQEDDELVHALLEYCTGITCQFLKLMAKTGCHMLSNGDSPAGPDLLSPRYYAPFALPYEKRVADCSHELGLPYILHICGKTDRILNQMLEIGARYLQRQGHLCGQYRPLGGAGPRNARTGEAEDQRTAGCLCRQSAVCAQRRLRAACRYAAREHSRHDIVPAESRLRPAGLLLPLPSN
jgi:uroporphyrinogen decarboxylase